MSAVEQLNQNLPARARSEFGAVERLASGIEGAAGQALAAQARAMVESRYVMALRNPRDWDRVRQNLLRECERPTFANNKSAIYFKPVGDGVEGLGIRFVEVGLRCMTNVLAESFMVYEDEFREVHRVCVTDLECNDTHYTDVKVAKTVERSRPMDDGGYLSVRMNSKGKPVYTVPANDDELLNKRGALISKALRTVGLRIIPGYLQDEATEAIKRVRLDKAAQDPDAERRAIADAFDELNIGVAQLTGYLGHELALCTPHELVQLRGLYGALRDGQATWATVMENKAERAGALDAQAREREADEIKRRGVEAVRAKANGKAAANGSAPPDSGTRGQAAAPAEPTPAAAPAREPAAPAAPTTAAPTLADALALIARGVIAEARDLARSLPEAERAQVMTAINAHLDARSATPARKRERGQLSME